MSKDSQAKSATETGKMAVLGQGEIDPGVHGGGAGMLSMAPAMNRSVVWK